MYNEKFESLCRRFNVDPVSTDGDLANVFFNLGVKFALKEQTSEPVLIVDQPFRIPEKDLLAFADSQEIDFEYINDPDDLTQADVQRLMHVLRTILSAFETHKQVANASINLYWELSDVNRQDDPSVQHAYAALNRWKESKADITEKGKQLAEIQRKLKKIAKLMNG